MGRPDRAAVKSNILPAKIVGQDVDDIGMLARAGECQAAPQGAVHPSNDAASRKATPI